MRTSFLPTRRAAALGAALLLVACAGEDTELYELAGSLEGESFAVASTSPDELVAAVDPGGAADDVEASANVDEPATADEPGEDEASTATHDPADGVPVARPENLPEGIRYLAFDDVSWPDYEPLDLRDIDAEPFETDEFPMGIRELDGQEVAFDGYMVPVDFEDRRVTTFILSRYLPGCCFGVMPRMDEWIEIDVLVEGGVEYFPYQIVRVTGTFEVGEMLDDYGYVRSIYRIRAEDVDENF